MDAEFLLAAPIEGKRIPLYRWARTPSRLSAPSQEKQNTKARSKSSKSKGARPNAKQT
jgi:hypothetical protein